MISDTILSLSFPLALSLSLSLSLSLARTLFLTLITTSFLLDPYEGEEKLRVCNRIIAYQTFAIRAHPCFNKCDNQGKCIIDLDGKHRH